MVEKEKKEQSSRDDKGNRKSLIEFSGKRADFARHGINQLNLDSPSLTIGEYTQDDVKGYIEDYSSAEAQTALMEISDILYIRSPQFRRLVQYFSDMATFAYTIMPKEDIVTNASPDSIMDEYHRLATFARVLNIRHEFRKVALEVFKSDVFFGYAHYTEDDFYIQKMPREACAISSVEDGVFNYSIHMPTIDENIDIYKYTMPEEVITLYNEWLREQQSSSNNNRNNRNSSGGRGGNATQTVKKEDEMASGDWKELSAENTICIKFDENNWNINIPPFASTFNAVFEIDGYKASRRNREAIDNYMMIFQKIPMRSDAEENNDFTIDYDSVEFFHGELSESVPESVGVVTTPMELSPIEFAKDSVDIDNVAKSERDFWSASGTSQALFSTENNTTQGINMSINTDEQIVFALLRQLERWINRFTKYAFGETVFSIEILDVTYFNQKNFYESMLKLSQFGVPVKSLIPSAMGIEPIQISGMAFLENEVLGIHKNWIPLQSSHTMPSVDNAPDSKAGNGATETTNEDTGGRPKENIEDLSDETLRKT